MLGIGGKFVGAKGMALVPDLSGLTPPQADTAITSAGLTIGTRSQSQTSNSSQNNKITSQGIAANTLVDYDTEISYQYLTYVEPPPPAQPPPTITYGNCDDQYDQIDYAEGCSGPVYTYPYSILKYRSKVYADGVWTGGYLYNCGDQRVPEFASDAPIPGECGVPAEPTCDSSKWTATTSFSGPCQSNNTYEKTTRYVNDCKSIADDLRKTYPACCYKSGTCGDWSAWSGSSGGQTRTRTCYRTSTVSGNCVSYTETETRCSIACTAWGGGTCVSGKKTQTRTCTAADCSTSKETRVVSCTGGAV